MQNIPRQQSDHVEILVNEDFEAFAMRHSYAVAYRDFKYENLDQEQLIIDNLL